jgi:hypothetical protein
MAQPYPQGYYSKEVVEAYLSRSHHMCKKITCVACAKPTWEGCGEHIEDALGDVAVADRCTCK